MITFEEYIKSQIAKGALDFTFRATSYHGQVQVYIRPLRVNDGEIGDTTPTCRVQQNEIIWPLGGWTIAKE